MTRFEAGLLVPGGALLAIFSAKFFTILENTWVVKALFIDFSVLLASLCVLLLHDYQNSLLATAHFLAQTLPPAMFLNLKIYSISIPSYGYFRDISLWKVLALADGAVLAGKFRRKSHDLTTEKRPLRLAPGPRRRAWAANECMLSPDKRASSLNLE